MFVIITITIEIIIIIIMIIIIIIIIIIITTINNNNDIMSYNKSIVNQEVVITIRWFAGESSLKEIKITKVHQLNNNT